MFQALAHHKRDVGPLIDPYNNTIRWKVRLVGDRVSFLSVPQDWQDTGTSLHAIAMIQHGLIAH